MLQLLPTSGAGAWALDSIRAPLPNGLSDRTSVTIVEVILLEDGRTQKITVADSSGRRWDLCRMQLDAGHAMYLDGEYCTLEHPKAVLHLRHTLHKLMTSGESWWREDIERIRWYLYRHGNDPDVALAPGPSPTLTGIPLATPTGDEIGMLRLEPSPSTEPEATYWYGLCAKESTAFQFSEAGRLRRIAREEILRADEAAVDYRLAQKRFLRLWSDFQTIMGGPLEKNGVSVP